MQTQTAIGIILLMAASAGAQDAVERPAITAAQVQRTFDAVAARRAQQALQLTDADHARFAPRLQALQEARRRHRVATNRILADLRRLTNPQAAASDEGAITERLRALREEQDRGTAELRRAHDAIDEVLDVRQQARFLVFEERMEQQKLDLLLRARQNARAQRGRQ
jgi:hypothetical protein